MKVYAQTATETPAGADASATFRSRKASDSEFVLRGAGACGLTGDGCACAALIAHNNTDTAPHDRHCRARMKDLSRSGRAR